MEPQLGGGVGSGPGYDYILYSRMLRLPLNSPFAFRDVQTSPFKSMMMLRAALSMFLVVATVVTLSATSADARKKKYRIKPYPNTGIVRRAPNPDFVPPKGADINMRPNPLILPSRQSACGQPPCAGGATSLGTRDIRNYQPGDIRARSPGIR